MSSLRMIASSHPTLRTQEPFDQKGNPVKSRFWPRYSRYIRIADFPVMALTSPPKEKPHLAPSLNAGTAEPLGVSPPEAVAYQVLVMEIPDHLQ